MSILNAASWKLALIKIHSVILSSNISNLNFGFVVFENEDLSLEDWNRHIKDCFASYSISYQSVRWKSLQSLKKYLTNSKFETEIIYSRFYLPMLFPLSKRILYLDNDIVVNADLSELSVFPLNSPSTGLPVPAAFVFEKAIFYKFYIKIFLFVWPPLKYRG